MDLIDSKYIGLVSSRLQKFKRVKSDLYNFRCPICGDSQKHKNKARGYIYQVKNNSNFKCHNCGASMSLNNFLKTIDTTLHKQYTLEKFKEGHTGRNFVAEEPTFTFKKPVFKKKLDLPKASEDPDARRYLEKRKLNPEKFYFTDSFKRWTNTKKQTFDTIGRDEPRIIIPMYNQDKDLIGFQGRSLVPNSVKYITVMLDDEAPKIYGLDTINEDLPVYVVQKDHLTALSSTKRLLCVVVTVTWVILGDWTRFLFMITNRAIEKLSIELGSVLTEVRKSSSGQAG